ncbi:glycosyltransferase family 2 protein [Kosmotoga pacifica]|uniref:Glycosyl transferase n=1 Tax=Kosmotoga pacifica TaxID=1330330 RepID=A0A0G2ZD82_9BACT|nr:glycosyltransferase family A protein [Kosmotoga pacifica]AKI98026.1 glycosyl transferase [Kosmotoga pacifica]
MSPLITVVVPVLNEEEFLEDTLRSIRSQSFKDYELIVVDNGSTDKSPEIALRYADKVVFEKRRGSIYAMHTGFEIAAGDIITSCDADTLYPSDWLLKMSKAFERENIVAVYGPMAFRENGPVLRKLTVFSYCFLNGLSNLAGVSLSGAANLGFRKNAYFTVGGYKLDSKIASQDFMLVKSLRKTGKVKFCPSMVCYTSNRRYTKVNFMHGLREAFRLWLDVALNKNKITYDEYYDDDYYKKKEK